MSMILDALSRAEKERRHEQNHELDTGRYVPSSTIKEDRFKKWVFIALLVNFILIIVILAGYLWRTDMLSGMVSDQHHEAAPVPPPANVATVQTQQAVKESKVVQTTVNQTSPKTENSSLLNEAQVNKKSIQAAIKPTPKATTHVPPVSYSPKPLEQIKKPSIPKEQLLAVQKSSPDQDYLLITDLAPAQRSRLNKYEVNVHVYDENAQNSFVLINMTKYKKGDRLPGGQEHVTSIIPEGVVIDFGGGRVLIERN